jgi:hypothetical protein
MTLSITTFNIAIKRWVSLHSTNVMLSVIAIILSDIVMNVAILCVVDRPK